MIYLLLAILSSATISIVMRISSNKITANLSMLAVNYLVCTVFSGAYAGFSLVTPEVPGFSLTVWLGILTGVLYLAGFWLFQRNVRKNGIVLSSVFMKLGLLVPMVMSVLVFREVPTALQITGFCIALGAILLINLKKDKDGKRFGIGLIGLLLASGGADAMSKIFEGFGPAVLSDPYLFYTFLAAFLLCTVLVLRKRERPGLKEILFGTLIGIPNFFSARFLLGALTQLPAVVVYPTFSVATLLIVTLAGVAVFRERLGKRQTIALVAILAALILLNS